jgi:mono/diheme cytochrome c family protein
MPVIGRRGGPALSADERDLLQRGGAIFSEICRTCHGDDGRGAPAEGAGPGVTLGPPLAGSPRVQGHRDYVIRVLLNGLTGPVGDRQFTEVMVPMGSNPDEWIAAAASYVRNSFGNSAGFVTPADVARVRAATSGRKAPWTVADIEAGLPRRLDATPTWRATASHNAVAASQALTLVGWTSRVSQESGMWFEIELPRAERLAELQFDSVTTGRPTGAAAPPGNPPDPAAAAIAALGFPRGYRVEVSMDGRRWSPPLAEGRATGARTTIAFAPTEAKFVRITQTDRTVGLPPWSILNLRLLTAGE